MKKNIAYAAVILAILTLDWRTAATSHATFIAVGLFALAIIVANTKEVLKQGLYT